jgi:hypothetical protein
MTRMSKIKRNLKEISLSKVFLKRFRLRNWMLISNLQKKAHSSKVYEKYYFTVRLRKRD